MATRIDCGRTAFVIALCPNCHRRNAIAMKSGSRFALAAIWETWRNPETDEDARSFAVITCPPNEMMATIHDGMPVILHEADYERWSPVEPDP